MKIFSCDLEQKSVRSSLKLLQRWGVGEIFPDPCPIKARIEMGKNFARIRTIRPEVRELNNDPLPIEIRFEERKLSNCLCGKGTVYDGPLYAELLRSQVSTFDISWLKDKPVFITRDYIASFDEREKRYHLRYAIFSFPVIISLPGIIEAPARPREYYIARGLGTPIPDDLWEKALIDLKDRRLPRVLAGILLQAWFFYETGYPFCSDAHCSLFNAHRQEELLNAQKDKPYVLCDTHSKILGEKR